MKHIFTASLTASIVATVIAIGYDVVADIIAEKITPTQNVNIEILETLKMIDHRLQQLENK